MIETQHPQPPADYPSLLMSVPPVAPTDPQVREQAFEWYERLSSPERARALWPRFEQWLAEHEEHRPAYLWVERVSRESRELAADYESDPEGAGMKPPLKILGISLQRREGPFRFRVPLVVASVMIGGVLLLARATQADVEFETERGKWKTVMLDDHSVVTLNTNTRVHVRFTLMHRELELLRGQAFFQVYRDLFRPFCVHAKETAVKANDTQFAMHLRDDGDVETVVAQGEATVTPRNAAGPTATPAADEKPILAKAGDMVTVTPAGRAEVTHTEASYVDRELKWREGIISLDQASLAQWVEEFNRYNHRTFQIDDERIAQLPITGEFKAKDPDRFAHALQETYQIQVNLDDTDDVIHLRPAK